MDYRPLTSDHSAILAWLSLNTNLPAWGIRTDNSSNRLMRLPHQFCWENDYFLKFKNTLRTEPIQILIRNYLERDDGDVNTSLTDAINILTATSKLCLRKLRKRKRIKKTSNNKKKMV